MRRSEPIERARRAERHDGTGVTCDDFRAAMADANGRDLAQFENWYLQAGTPVVEATTKYDAAAKTLTFAPGRTGSTGEYFAAAIGFGGA